ncbi:hypothetical protein HGRIS_003518 [Hohenbuehelia grisea]|uniref:Uncharacterized protein n=1 Tax=Hohenbuehelia grisea TaxID=104357 RepID=A0ABR3JGL5_9AGAR
MFSKSNLVCLTILALSLPSLGRERWLERENRPVFLYPRRFGQEQPAVLDKLRNACPGQFCGTLAGKAVTPLLAAQPECSQQDLADEIIDTSKQFDAATQANMLAIAIEYRQSEKNTPPDFSTNPPTLRNSVFCQKAPKNPELIGLVQAQDPGNDPNIFFDPALGKSVRLGDQANTAPFGGAGNAPAPAPAPEPAPAADGASDVAVVPTAVLVADGGATPSCVTAITITVIGTADVSATNAVTITAGDPVATTAAPDAGATAAPGGAGIGNFGSCSVPQIEFGVGFDNRKETSFQPVDKTSYDHGSAQNIDIITQFICDTLVNKCGADQTAKDTCAKGRAAASAATVKTGQQADAFNAAFGITTQFAGVTAIDNQGNAIPGTGNGAVAAPAASSPAAVVTNAPAANPATSAASTAATTPASAPPASQQGGGAAAGIGNFGKCSVPQVEFAAGFDGRRETSFQPTDKGSFNHGSAQNINIITQSICDTLTNSCGADQTAKATCARAQAAASAATAKTGAQADAFNNVFGISTNFAAVQPIDDQGRVVGAATGGAASAGNNANNGNNGNNGNAANNAAATTAAATQQTSQASSGNVAVANGNIQAFRGALGGVKAPVVTDIGNGQFQVEGNSVFNNRSNAVVRSCDVQQNLCSNAANASGNKGDLTVSACGAQGNQCRAAAA